MPIELPGIVLASLATLCLGVVLGPEAPLIAIGSGIGVLAVHLVKKDAPAQAVAVIGAAGSFAAISTLLGSPLVGAFLLMEAAGLGGPMLGVVLVPGLLAAGVGALIFVGLSKLDRLRDVLAGDPGHSALRQPQRGRVPLGGRDRRHRRRARRRHTAVGPRSPAGRRATQHRADAGRRPRGRRACDRVRRDDRTRARQRCSSPARTSSPGSSRSAADWSVGALVLLLVCKGLAYGLSLSSFRGGPVFPGSLPRRRTGASSSRTVPACRMIAGVGMGIGAMSVAMLNLPLTSVLLASVFLASDAVTLMPLIIVAVVVVLRQLGLDRAPNGTSQACSEHVT